MKIVGTSKTNARYLFYNDKEIVINNSVIPNIDIFFYIKVLY